MIFKTTASVLVLASMLSACATQQPAADWRNGARRGWIAKLYDTDVPTGEFSQCAKLLADEKLRGKRFAKVEYREVRTVQATLAQIPDSIDLHVNDRVELWLADCKVGKISTVSKSLSLLAK